MLSVVILNVVVLSVVILNVVVLSVLAPAKQLHVSVTREVLLKWKAQYS
jgi:hypothetical protein